MSGPVIEHIPFDLEAEIAAAMHACIKRKQLADDAERASREVFQRALREKKERADASAAAVAEMRMGGAI